MVVIRSIAAGDRTAARGVILAVFDEIFGRPPIDDADLGALDLAYGDGDALFLVAVDDDAVVGTGALRRLDATTAELKRMYLLAPYRGRGLGRAIALRLIDHARRRGFRRVRLDSNDEFAAAIALYRSLGFVDIARYNDGPASIFMELALENRSDARPA